MRKKILFASVVIFIAAFLLIAAAFGGALRRAIEFRRAPNSSKLSYFFDSEWPHKIFARSLILSPGSERYNRDLCEWMNDGKTVGDYFWNRRLLARQIAALPPPERRVALSSYPLPPRSDLLPWIREALNADHAEMIELLGQINTKDSRTIFRSWSSRALSDSKAAETFLWALPHLATWPEEMMPLLRKFWPGLDNEQKVRTLNTIGIHLKVNAVGSGLVLSWLSDLFRVTPVLHGGEFTILGRYLAYVETKEKAVSLLNREVSGRGELDEGIVDELLSALDEQQAVEVAGLVYKEFLPAHPLTAIEGLHAVAHRDISQAEVLAKPMLHSRDSVARKSVIVILARHDSVLGNRYLDEAFQKGAPRITKFLYTWQYAFGSSAGDQYVQIAGHDYLEVGKQWPPFFSNLRQLERERKLWPDFIERFPLFPGTDDAYYRLAYSYYAAGDYSKAVETVLSYFEHEHPDNDAEPYLQFLARMIARSGSAPAKYTELIGYARVLMEEPPGILIFRDAPEVLPTMAGVDWFLARPRERTALGATQEELVLVKKALNLIATTPKSHRYQRVAELLAGDASLPAVLYGRFHNGAIEGENVADVSTSNYELALREIRSQLARARIAKNRELCQSLIKWALLHEADEEIIDPSYAEYMDDPRYAEWMAFDPLLEEVRASIDSGGACQGR